MTTQPQPQPAPPESPRTSPEAAEKLVRRRLGPSPQWIGGMSFVLVLVIVCYLSWFFYGHSKAAMRFGLFNGAVKWHLSSPFWKGGYTVVNLHNRYFTSNQGPPSTSNQPHEIDGLARLNRVEILDLTNAYQLDDQQLAVIARLPHLRELELGTAEVPTWVSSPHGPSPRGDLVLQYVEPLKNLEGLNLANSQITDKGLEHLIGLNKLHSLDLTATKITDASFATLDQLPALNTLILTDTAVTAEGLAAFQRKRPEIFVDHELNTSPLAPPLVPDQP